MDIYLGICDKYQNLMTVLAQLSGGAREKSIKVSKGAKIRNRYNQVQHLTQDTYGKVQTHS